MSLLFGGGSSGGQQLPAPVILPRADAPPRPLDPATMAARDKELSTDRNRRGLAAQFRSGYGLKSGQPNTMPGVKSLLGQ